MILGRIVTKSKNLKTLDFVEKTETYTEDKSVITLIVGKQRSKEVLGDDFSVFDRVVNDNLRWTFLKTEKRNEYENDLESFNRDIVERIKEKCHYYSVNLFSYDLRLIKRLVSYFTNDATKYVYLGDRQIYVYSASGGKKKNDSVVLGISMDEMEYLGVSVKKAIEKLKKMNNCVIIYDESFLSNVFTKYFKDYKTYIPYLYFLKNQ